MHSTLSMRAQRRALSRQTPCRPPLTDSPATSVVELGLQVVLLSRQGLCDGICPGAYLAVIRIQNLERPKVGRRESCEMYLLLAPKYYKTWLLGSRTVTLLTSPNP